MKPSLRTLLDGIVDYAGLFPPAKLDMRPAVDNYARYVESDMAWMLGRFVLPAARLGEFIEAAPAAGPVWRLSALVAVGGGEGVRKFNDEHDGRFVIDSIELKADSPGDVPDAVSDMPEGASVFVEIPWESDPREWIEAAAEAGAMAKIRTGGVTPQLFPAAADVARFIVRCRDAGVGLKATAGLHHPLRAEYRLTYEADGAMGVMHGFLNVFLAAAMAQYGARRETVTRVLETTRADDFVFEDDRVQVFDHRFSVADLAETRSFMRSFGSCSFEEPIDDLKGLGFL